MLLCLLPLPTPMIPLPITYNRNGTHRFVPSTILLSLLSLMYNSVWCAKNCFGISMVAPEKNFANQCVKALESEYSNEHVFWPQWVHSTLHYIKTNKIHTAANRRVCEARAHLQRSDHEHFKLLTIKQHPSLFMTVINPVQQFRKHRHGQQTVLPLCVQFQNVVLFQNVLYDSTIQWLRKLEIFFNVFFPWNRTELTWQLIL